jgi:Type IV secretory system Conjugative DNA transfer
MIQTPPSAQRQSGIGTYVLLAALWLVPGLVFALAALLAGGAPHTHIVDWPYYAIRSLTHDGRVAPWVWVGAAEVRSPIIFWAVAVAVTTPFLIALVVGAVVLRGGIPAVFPFLAQPRMRSRWAHAGALTRAGLMTSGPTGRRLVLGRHRDGWVALREGASALVLGPPGSGKSAALGIPAIGEWDGCVVAVSDGTDLIETAAGVRQHRGRVDVLDVSERTGLGTCTWAPAVARMTFDEAVALVENTLGGREPAPDGLTRQLLTCVLYAAANRGMGVAGAVTWLDDVSGATLVRSLLQVRDRDPRATSWAHRLVELDHARRAECFSAVRQLLRAHFEQVARGTSARAFQATEFLAGGASTLFIVLPTGGSPGSASIASLLDALVTEAEDRRVSRQLLVVLEGCEAVASMPGLADHLAGRSGAVTVLATLRDLDFCGALAERDLNVLAERASAIVLMGGGGNREGGVSDLMHQLVRRQLATRNRPWTRGRGDDSRPDLLPPEAARHLGFGRALLVHERIAPAVLWMRNCYEDADLRTRFLEHPYVRGVARIQQVS